MVAKFLDDIRDLPVMPEVATRVLRMAEGRSDITFRELESMIKADPGLTAKILKIANSALYARQKEIKSLQTAISLLGFKNIRNLILLLSASKLFPKMKRTPFHRVYWRHSTLSAFLAQSVSLRCNRSDFAEEAFIAGLLHEIGQAVLLCAAPEEYSRVLEAEETSPLGLEALEEAAFSVNHKEVGGELLKRWNFPDVYVDATREHGTLNITSAHKPLIIVVSLACAIADGIESDQISKSRADLFTQLLPYTPLPAGDLRSFVQTYTAELTQHRLFHEYQNLLDIS